MSEHSRDLFVAGGKLAAGPGVAGIGLWTLNDMALFAGIVSSLIIAAHTAWKFWCDVRDRRGRGPGG